MYKTRRSARAAVGWRMLIAGGSLAMALGCREPGAEPPQPAPRAAAQQRTADQARQPNDTAGAEAGQLNHLATPQGGQARNPAGTLTETAAGAAAAEHAGPWALDGSEEGPVAGLPLIITLELPEVPAKIRGPTPLPGG